MRPSIWVGASKKDYMAFPVRVRQIIGFALYRAQIGASHDSAKPLKGFGGAGVVELVEHGTGGTYRTVYTVRFGDAVYALHAFQKKAKRGIATPRKDIELVRNRLKDAERLHRTLIETEKVL